MDQDEEDYTVLIHIKKLNELHTNCKSVAVLLIYEIGYVGQQLLSKIDQALLIAKEISAVWFGGMIVIFSEDF